MKELISEIVGGLMLIFCVMVGSIAFGIFIATERYLHVPSEPFAKNVAYGVAWGSGLLIAWTLLFAATIISTAGKTKVSETRGASEEREIVNKTSDG